MHQKLLKILQDCKSLKQLKQSHLQIFIHGLQHSSFLLPKLLTLSSQLGFLHYAYSIFQTSCSPNVVAYNTIIKCFIGKTRVDALRVYDQMKTLRIVPNGYTFTFLLRCFESFEALEDGKVVHGDIVKLGFGSSVFVQNTLLDFYAKCAGGFEFGSARQVFDEMAERDVVSWNSMIAAYMTRGRIEPAMRLFHSVPKKNIVTWNSVVSGLSKAGNMELAHSVFEEMPERNDVSWNSLITAYMRLGDMSSARCLFEQMPEKTVVSWTAMVSGYTAIGDVESARNLFSQMPVKNVVSWNAMIAGYVHNHMFDQALSVFREMLIDGKCRPDQSTLISVLSACTHLGSLEHGKWIESYVKRNKFDMSVPLGNALIDMYAKCGDVENAKAVFDEMEQRCIITWTTMVSGLAVNGWCREALALFETMCLSGHKPDDVIFIVALSACTHGGLVDEGKIIFYQMEHEFDIKPRIEHYGCMVDLLGRAGKLEEALRFVENMHLEPNAVIWASLLGSCKIHGNGDLVESVTRRIIEQEPENPSYLTLVSNLSASVGQWKDVLIYRQVMRQQGIEKVPGCSSIQMGNKIDEFLAHDTRHEERKEIYGVLNCLNEQVSAVSDGL
ncbi:putative tetratricopeptide-like helical domain-containing protein [Rosa chinensis]|uniref:Putative tetratricopeptide-like helical domain-containing protein n=1 Tax=Rosa chinensis TaxID=74649 RepID=A0A2P6PSH6_ROSCH|nr:pentatricopeptide repeat-containing protein At1g08070, chloroplastic [Rosa chinensis]XP_040363941.1 pentatricopeptide repeat-containing protein At1g08070, chloroplastic [Rosa chinensis]PRQ24885.1 putative tetratricopeptide-like helical domain-containing protein [Rosa chinensis]